MVKKYAKKPVIIEAVQWTGYNFDEIQDFAGFNNVYFQRMTDPPKIYVPTLEGAEYASINDYIIKFADGEVRTCDADFFETNYEEAE